MYLAIHHKSEDILQTVEGHNAALYALPHSLPIRTAFFYGRSHAVDKLGISDGDLDIRALDVALKSVYILSHHELTGIYGRLMLCYLRLEEGFEMLAILGLERDRRCDVQVVLEVGNVQHDGVAVLRHSEELYRGLAAM